MYRGTYMKDNKKILNNEIWIKERIKEDRNKRRKTEAWRYKKIEPVWRSGPRQVWTIWAYRVPVVPLTQICRLPPWTAIKPNTPETRYILPKISSENQNTKKWYKIPPPQLSCHSSVPEFWADRSFYRTFVFSVFSFACFYNINFLM